MKIKDRDSFVQAYAYQVVDDMDMKSLCVFAQETLEGYYADYSDDELIEVVKDSAYDYLLEDNVE